MQVFDTRNIALDFHGTTFDHRISKYLYFQLVAGVDYEDPFIDRSRIIEKVESMGYSRGWYFETLSEFFKTEWSLSGEISKGLQSFIDISPSNWRFIVLSGMSSNILSIRRIIAYSDLSRISGVYRVPDSHKPKICEHLGIQLYFDDKPDTLQEFTDRGIKCIQVSTEGYSNISEHASLHFNNWIEVAKDMSSVRALIN